ncbi:hypothetical protein C8J57DRAFT_1299645 [Mycena rebaudengoi]|nr:hypothetical protein C8J57DRAFT_1299645 [Mycena rebaudengoi]
MSPLDEGESSTPPFSDISILKNLMEEQLLVLKRMDQRQATGDLSFQPIPDVPATSGSAWNALLNSMLSVTIQPKVDRWRSGLDALLVFLGLFSAIVTAFLVNSLAGLKQNDTARTNELVANLTNILIAISGINTVDLNISEPLQFRPNTSDIRLNSYWFLSLILSLCIAALAVACRGFLNMVTWSRGGTACKKLTDIRRRWDGAEKTLGPAIEALPQILVVPVLLFMVGLIDMLLSNVMQLPPAALSLFAACGLALLSMTGVASAIGYTLFDAGLHPERSPFCSTLSRFISISIIPALRSIFYRYSLRRADVENETILVDNIVNEARVYHDIVQNTHDDDTLDKASAALASFVSDRGLNEEKEPDVYAELASLEYFTILHLLSPEASLRSNVTAAHAILQIQPRNIGGDLETLLCALVEASKRFVARMSLSVLWDSQFLIAMSHLVGVDPVAWRLPPAVAFLSSNFARWDMFSSRTDYSAPRLRSPMPFIDPGARRELLQFVLAIFAAKFEEMAPFESTSQLDAKIHSLLSSTESPSTTIDISNVLFSLPFGTTSGWSEQWVPQIVRWLMRVKRPPQVIRAAHSNIADITPSLLTGALTSHEVGIINSVISNIVDLCLPLPDFVDHEPLLRICVDCLLNTLGMEGSSELTRTMLKLLRAMQIPAPKSDLFQSIVCIYKQLQQQISSESGDGASGDLPDAILPQEVILHEFQFVLAHAAQ